MSTVRAHGRVRMDIRAETWHGLDMTHTVAEYAELFRKALLEDVIPFWERHSIDHECGGYFTCLDRRGGVFDTDKFVWLQARQVWMFSHLYNVVERRESWLEIARHGAEFLRRHGRDAEGNWYFSLNREGMPLVQPYNIFSDCFAAMAFAKYAIAAQDDQARQIATDTFQSILRRRDNPKGMYSKAYPGTRPLKTLSIPMILTNILVEMDAQLPDETVRQMLTDCAQEIIENHYDPTHGLLFERVGPSGEHSDTFDGRLLSPGHSVECMWFVIEGAVRSGNSEMIPRAEQIILNSLEFGWDREYGGLFYYMDALGKPPEKLEWDQKLWWVHAEALVALAVAYRETRNPRCMEWFERMFEYTWPRFPDPEHGEWWGYLNRRGEVLLQLKGGKWKGCFHVPRALWICGEVFGRLDKEGQTYTN